MAFVKRARLPQAEDSAPMHVSRIGAKPQSFPIAKRKEMGVRKRSVT